MNDFHPPPPGPNEPPPPYVASEASSHAPPPSSTSFQSTPENPPVQAQVQPQSQHQQQESAPAPTSAAQYFASRPSNNTHIFTYPLHIRPNSLRSEYPYPRDWAPSRDVSVQDWSTFVGFLIPDDAVTPDAKGLSPERRRNVEATIQEWDDGFFLPRGVKIYFDDGHNPPKPQRPGTNSWDTSSFATLPSNHGRHSPSTPGSVTSSSASSRPPPRSSKERWTRKLKDVATEKEISLTHDSLRMGDKFSLSPGGLKIGKFALDERGMNYAGKQIGPQIPPGALQPHHGAPPASSYPGYPHAQHAPYHGSTSSFGPSQQGPRPPAGPSQGESYYMHGQPNPGFDQGQQYAPPSGPPPGHHPQQQTGTIG